MNTNKTYTYTGHETFACRSYWLKKGFDFLSNGLNFNTPEAPAVLGVGKNMVRSIRHWLKAFNLEENGLPSYIANRIFDDEKGWDPYLEDINTIWLLHYLLLKTEYAKIYSDFFNEFKKQQSEFSLDHFERFLKLSHSSISDNTLRSDINVLKINFIRSDRKNTGIEDVFSVFLQELGLIEQLSSGVFRFNTREKKSLDDRIFFFTLLDNFHQERSISFDRLKFAPNSPGNVYSMSQDELFTRITRLSDRYDGVVFTEDAGLRELQIDEKYFSEMYQVLEDFYEK